MTDAMHTLTGEIAMALIDIGAAAADLIGFSLPTGDDTKDRRALDRAVKALDRASAAAHEALRLYDHPPHSRGVRETAA